MIDFEVKIFNDVHSVAAPLCAKNRFVSTPINSYADLPACSLFEMDSFTVRNRQSSTPKENFSRVTYQVTVAAKDKEKCRSIFKVVDERMIQLNFTRISGQYITDPENPDFVQYVARYEADIDQVGNIYRVS